MSSFSRVLVEARRLVVQYPNFRIGPVSMTVGEGIHVFLGPNGAGKSTLMRAIATLQPLASGELTVCGKAVRGRSPEVLEKCGIAFDGTGNLPCELTASEFWALLARIRAGKDVKKRRDMEARARELAEGLAFSDSNRPIGVLSLGNKKKVQIVGALMGQPELILLDEPHSGLDPASEYLFDSLLASSASDGVGIIVATHDLRWAQETARDVYLLSDGDVVHQGSVAALVAEYGSLSAAYRELA